jgi:hypothetical protein
MWVYISCLFSISSVVISNIFGKKRNSIVTFQSGHLKEQPKTMDDLGCFDLKMFRNCPIRIEIITGPIYVYCFFHGSTKRQDLYVLNWKSSYDVMLFTCQNCQQHFAEFSPLWKVHNDKYAIHKINKHSCIGNRLKRYRKQTGNINPHSLRRSRITYSILAYRTSELQRY